MTTKHAEELNSRYPLNLLIDIVDDDKEWIVPKVVERLNAKGITNVRVFHSGIEYRAKLKDNPTLRPHLAIFDLKLDASEHMSGIDLTIQVTKETRRRRVKTKVIMISGSQNFEDCKNFTNNDGFRWLDKDDKDFDLLLTTFLEDAVSDILEAMEEKKYIDDLMDDLPDLELEENGRESV